MKRFGLLFGGGCLVIAFTCFMFIVCAKKESGKIPITTNSPEALQDFLKGQELFEKLRAQESLTYFRKAIEKDPNFALARLYYAQAQPTPKGFFQEIKKVEQLIEHVSEGERLWIQGFLAQVNGFPMKQRKYFRKLVEAYPRDERAHNLLGNHYFSHQEWHLAIAEYEKALEINPEFSQPYNQLGYAYRYLGDYQQAEKVFKKYIKLIPDDPNPYDSYAELLMKIGDFESSINEYKKALEVDSQFVPSHLGIATNLNFLERHEEAREQLKKVLRMARNVGERRQAYFSMAVSYVDEGRPEEALKMLQKQYALADSIHDVAAQVSDLVNMGNVLFEMGRYQQASEKYESSLQLVENSDLSDEIKDNARRLILYYTARIALKQGNLEEAKNKADKFKEWVYAVNNTFQIWLTHELDGMIALEEKKYRQAIEELKQANQQNPYVLYYLARAYQAAGNREKAREFAQMAAHHNTLNSMSYAFIRKAAMKMLTSLQPEN
ncbi:MAG: hypothetical protein Kow0042_21390 [Calditrichia bacterium]